MMNGLIILLLMLQSVLLVSQAAEQSTGKSTKKATSIRQSIDAVLQQYGKNTNIGVYVHR